MGSYVFRWPYPADDVHVTGTFDDWGKSEQLNKVGDIWEKEVFLPSADEKILYKFVVDDQWIVDERAPKEGDGHNNVNNVLLPGDITRKEVTSQAPGAFPETPGTEQTFNILPIPATSGTSNPITLAPGDKVPHPRELTSNTIASTATTSKEDYEKAGQESESFSVNPIPASSGVGNPVHLAPGQPIPSDVQQSKIDSAATTSKEDYENAGQEPETISVAPIPASSGLGNPIKLAPGQPIPADVNQNSVDAAVTTSKEDYERSGSSAFPAALGAGAAAAGIGGIAAATAFKKPEATEKLIPESSLPIGGAKTDTLDAGPFISSVAPGTSAAELASKVPLEKNTASPFISSAAPGTTTADLASKVPVDSKPVDPTISSAAPGTTASALAAKVPLEQTQTDPTISSAAPGTSAAALAGGVPLEQRRQGMIVDPSDVATTSVPETVQQSIGKAHQDPEAAASAEAVKEKTEVEKELLSKVKPSEAKGESASAAAQQTSYHGLATSVPSTVESSMAKAHAAPEAAANASVVAEKSAVEQELLNKIPSSNAVGQSAPTAAAATSATAPTATTSAHEASVDPSLADEPAVQLMQQNDAPAGGATTHAHEATTTTTTAATGVPTSTDAGTADGTPSSASKAAVAPTSPPSTPAKKTGPSAAVDSPASTTATEKSRKKRHRLSTYIKNLLK